MTSRHVVPGEQGPQADPPCPQEIVDQLQRKLESLPTIEQAKGILMARFSLDADTAFTLLVRWSQFHNLKLRAVSASLVDAAATPGALDALIDGLQSRTATAGSAGAAVRR